MAERRNFVRIQKNIKVNFKVIVDRFANPGIPANMSHTTTLSGNGMTFMSPKPIDKGTKLEFTIDIPDGKGDGIDTSGEVLGAKKLGENEHEIIIKFLDIDTKSRDRLSAYVMREDVKEKMKAKKKK